MQSHTPPSPLSDDLLGTLFRLLVSRVGDYAVFLLDPRGVILTWNQHAEEMKGYRPEEAIGQFFGILYSDEDQARGHPEHNLKCAAREGNYLEEGWRKRKDGRLFWASVEIIALRSEDGRLLAYGKIVRDLTARKQMEDQLRETRGQAERAAFAREEMLRIVSHDLHTPLTTILMSADLIERSANDEKHPTDLARHLLGGSSQLPEIAGPVRLCR
jgi:PAS domain S-box-containing protein